MNRDNTDSNLTTSLRVEWERVSLKNNEKLLNSREIAYVVFGDIEIISNIYESV